jgi:hypothetical protein
VELSAVFFAHAGHMDDTPHLRLSGVMPPQHREPLVHIKPVCLRPALAALHLDAGGVHDHVLHALGDQAPVDLSSVTTGLVAAEHPSILW